MNIGCQFTAGDAIYKKVIQDAEDATKYQPVTTPGACFIAGTLVHTKDGWKLLSLETAS